MESLTIATIVCEEKQRLTDEYFDALKRQHWIRQRLE
jgi:hypothetical protein